MVKILHIPEVKGIQEAKAALSKMLEELERGTTYLIRGPHGKTALLIGVEEFRELQESYLELLAELETRKTLDEEKREALRAASEDFAYREFSSDELVTSEEVKERDLTGRRHTR
jgi:Antitoxin Phd_YefM, type II toxin-antitoxin system